MILGNYYRLLNKINKSGKDGGIKELRGGFRTHSNAGSKEACPPFHVFLQWNVKNKTKHSLICCYINQQQSREQFCMLEQSWIRTGLFINSPKRLVPLSSAYRRNCEAIMSSSVFRVQLISLYLCMDSAECCLWPPGDRRGHLHGHAKTEE